MSEAPTRIASQLVCKQCGKFFVNGPTMATCPDMHGKLHRKMTAKELGVVVAAQLPVIISGDKLGEHYLNGVPVRAIARFPIGAAVKRFYDGEEGIARCDKFTDGFGKFKRK